MGYESWLAAIMGVIEGLTEFIPVSSTGHLILTEEFIGFDKAVGKEVAGCFDVFIQTGAILAVIVAFPRRFVGLLQPSRTRGFAGLRGIGLLALTTLPALIVGFALRKFVKEHLFFPVPVALALAFGAIWILVAEYRGHTARKEGLDALTPLDALIIGCFQCLAMWPGMSRSAATILGAMSIGIHRKTAAEYSFFAAVPVLCAAAIWELIESRSALHAEHIPLFAIGFGVAFVCALASVKLLIYVVSRFSLTPFAWYRLLLAAVVLTAALAGWLPAKD